MMRPTTPTEVGLGYLPVRSPLLRESRLISTPPGTEMVQFPGSRLHTLCVQVQMTGHHASRVTPFGNRRIAGCVLLPVAFRSLPRPSSPGGSKASTVDSYLLDHMSLSRRSRSTPARSPLSLRPHQTALASSAGSPAKNAPLHLQRSSFPSLLNVKDHADRLICRHLRHRVGCSRRSFLRPVEASGL